MLFEAVQLPDGLQNAPIFDARSNFDHAINHLTQSIISGNTYGDQLPRPSLLRLRYEGDLVLFLFALWGNLITSILLNMHLLQKLRSITYIWTYYEADLVKANNLTMMLSAIYFALMYSISVSLLYTALAFMYRWFTYRGFRLSLLLAPFTLWLFLYVFIGQIGIYADNRSGSFVNMYYRITGIAVQFSPTDDQAMVVVSALVFCMLLLQSALGLLAFLRAPRSDALLRWLPTEEVPMELRTKKRQLVRNPYRTTEAIFA